MFASIPLQEFSKLSVPWQWHNSLHVQYPPGLTATRPPWNLGSEGGWYIQEAHAACCTMSNWLYKSIWAPCLLTNWIYAIVQSRPNSCQLLLWGCLAVPPAPAPHHSPHFSALCWAWLLETTPPAFLASGCNFHRKFFFHSQSGSPHSSATQKGRECVTLARPWS